MLNNAPNVVELREKCPGSAGLSEGLPKQPQTEEMLKGLKLHAAIDDVLTKGLSPRAACFTHDVAGEFDWETVRVCDDVMKNHVREIEREVDAECAGIHTEISVNLQASGWDGRARLDITASFIDAHGILQAVLVVELKTGLTVVTGPEANRQLHDYLVGAAAAQPTSPVYYGAILQPAVVTELQWRQARWTKKEILEGFGTVNEIPGLAQQLTAIRLATQDPNAPLIWGTHCGTCRVKEMCPARRGTIQEAREILAASGSTVAEYMAKLEPIERAKAWQTMKEAGRYAEKFSDWVKAWILDNPKENAIPGFRVGTKPGNRIFDNKMPAPVLAAKVWELAGEELAAAGMTGPEGLLEVIGPKKVEDLLPKAAFTKLQAAGLVVRPEGAISVIEDKPNPMPMPRKK